MSPWAIRNNNNDKTLGIYNKKVEKGQQTQQKTYRGGNNEDYSLDKAENRKKKTNDSGS